MLTGVMTRERVASLPPNDWRSTKNPEFKEPALTRNLELVDFLRSIAERKGRSVVEVAVAWTLHHPAVTGAIVGGRRAEQVDGSIGAIELDLSEEEMAEIATHLP